MGMYTTTDNGASKMSAAWFHNCTFGEHKSIAPGEVAVEDRNGRVYADTPLPTVWDRDLRREVGPWRLTHRPDLDTVDAFADVGAGSGLGFLRPSDDLFRRIMANQAEVSGLPPAHVPSLPDATRLTVEDPYSAENFGIAVDQRDGAADGSDSSPWTRQRIGLIAGIGGAAVLVALAAALAIWCVRRRRKSAAEPEASEVRAAPWADHVCISGTVLMFQSPCDTYTSHIHCSHGPVGAL